MIWEEACLKQFLLGKILCELTIRNYCYFTWLFTTLEPQPYQKQNEKQREMKIKWWKFQNLVANMFF